MLGPMTDGPIIGSARIPGSGGNLTLHRLDDEFVIRVGDAELMTSRVHDSEDELSRLVCRRLAHLPEPSLLIGGLGMGYTLAAALKETGPKARITVAELVPGVVEWNRGPLAHLAGRPLDDPRVTVRVQDVAMSLQTEEAAYDGILLDVDNGPEGLVRAGNDWIYSPDGLSSAYTALRPDGILAVWSSTPEKTFAMRLRRIGFKVEEIRVSSTQHDDRHTIWLAVNRA